jgi:flagellar protein FliO/FliZ
MLPSFNTILTAAAALAAVIGFILVAARFARTGALPRRGGGSLTSREVLALDAGRRLHLVRCEGRDVLLLTGGPQDVVVGWLPEREPAP